MGHPFTPTPVYSNEMFCTNRQAYLALIMQVIQIVFTWNDHSFHFKILESSPWKRSPISPCSEEIKRKTKWWWRSILVLFPRYVKLALSSFRRPSSRWDSHRHYITSLSQSKQKNIQNVESERERTRHPHICREGERKRGRTRHPHICTACATQTQNPQEARHWLEMCASGSFRRSK